MVAVLAVSDEVIEGWRLGIPDMRPDLIIGAGDLPYDYLEHLSQVLNVPCVFVPGNHDPDLTPYSSGKVGWTRAGLPTDYPGPEGAINADGRVVEVNGLRIAGLGGSIRYRQGPNQWTEGQQRRRALKLRVRAWLRRQQQVDILLTHSPAKGVGDADDAPHRGFACLHAVTKALRPRVFVHGHIHPHGQPTVSQTLYGTPVLNTVGYTLFELDTDGGPVIKRRRHGA